MPRTIELRRRKIFSLIRILGGMISACYLGYVVLTNLAAGIPFNGPLILCAIIATAGFIYASWYLRELSTIACEERALADNNAQPPSPTDHS